MWCRDVLLVQRSAAQYSVVRHRAVQSSAVQRSDISGSEYVCSGRYCGESTVLHNSSVWHDRAHPQSAIQGMAMLLVEGDTVIINERAQAVARAGGMPSCLISSARSYHSYLSTWNNAGVHK